MEPVTVTLTTEYELAGYQRVRCYALAVEIRNLADEVDLGNIVAGSTDERAGVLLEQFEAAKAALEAIQRS